MEISSRINTNWLQKVLILIFLSSCHLTIGQNPFQDRFLDTSRFSRNDVKIELKDSLGNEVYLPISILKGKAAGPIFTIIAGVHGFEYPPIVAVQDVLKEINLQELNGTLIVVPIANTASFYGRTPFVNPMDGKNLNNAFPGNPKGTITEQIAHFITTNLISASDILLDIHGGDAPEDLLPFVCYYNNPKKPEETALAKKLSEKSGFQYVVSYPYTLSDEEPAKYTFKQAVQDGKTALSIECGKLGNVQEESVLLIKKGIYNMLETMNMYSNGSGSHPNIIYRNSQSYIRSKVKGIFYSTLRAGDSVLKNQLVGHTEDEFGVILEEYRAPKNGIILYKLATPPISVGNTVMCISSNEETKN